MCLLIETIKISEGDTENISWHNRRFNETRLEIYGIRTAVDLGDFIIVPEKFKTGVVKCRVGYGEKIDFIEFEPYVFRPVRSLKIVFDNTIQYNHKYRDRSQINKLFTRKSDKDDILIVKNGLIRESSYCNVVLWDGKKFYTPSSPLLKGTKRAKYISEGKLIEKDIKIDDLPAYREIHLINAFLEMGSCVISITDIN